MSIIPRLARQVVMDYLEARPVSISPPPEKHLPHDTPIGEFGRAICDMEAVEEDVRALMHRARRNYLFERRGL